MNSIDELKNRLNDLVSDEQIVDSKDGISLLALKNDAMLSYLNNLALIIGSKLIDDDKTRLSATKSTIEQRVTIEKGVKSLEAKVSYQIDKALRAFKRQQQQDQQQQQQQEDNQKGGSESESESDEDATAYRPNVAQLQAEDSSDEEQTTTPGKYTAPKIAKTSIAPKEQRRHKRRDFAMDEYLKEQTDAPIAEPSIGAAIMDSGRGGQSTEHDRRKEREIQEFEEANFTRISQSSKKMRKEAAKRQKDAMSRNAFGENWDFLDKGEGRGGRDKRRKRK